MRGSCNRHYRALALVSLAALLGGCTSDMSLIGSPFETTLLAKPDASDDSAARAVMDPNAPTRIALVAASSTPAPAGRAKDLSKAMADMLTDMGYDVVPPPPSPAPGERIYFITPKLDIVPAANGRGEKLGIDWLVSDALGEAVGKVSQARTLRSKPSPEQWRRQTLLSTAAAAEGIAQLIPVRP